MEVSRRYIRISQAPTIKHNRVLSIIDKILKTGGYHQVSWFKRDRFLSTKCGHLANTRTRPTTRMLMTQRSSKIEYYSAVERARLWEGCLLDVPAFTLKSKLNFLTKQSRRQQQPPRKHIAIAQDTPRIRKHELTSRSGQTRWRVPPSH